MSKTNQTGWRGISLGVVATILLSASTTAAAQTLEEVVVTATKRSESIQDVPISIGVVTGEMVERYDIVDLTDLQSFVPSLAVQSTFGNWSVRLRGLGSGVTNLAFDSSVSIFNDGVYCGRSQCLETALLDLERVEVARGPQGALFGKSTIAGAISVISAQPTDELTGYIQGGLEIENGGFNTAAAISGPITDTLSGRVAVRFKNVGNWVDNTFLGSKEGGYDSLAWRTSLAWDATDNVTFNFKLEGSDKSEVGNSNQLVNGGGPVFGARTTDPAPEFVQDNVRRVSTGTGIEGFEDNETLTGTLSMDADLGEHTLTVIASYSDMSMERYLDVDGVPENFLNTSLFTDYEQTSLEARLLSPTGNAIEYIVGALYHTSDVYTRQYSPFGFFPAFLAPVPVGMDRNFQRDADTVSVYGQVTWNVNDQFRVIVDGRYTEEEQDGVAFAFPVSFPNLVDPMRVPGAFAQPPEFILSQVRNDEHFDPSIRFQYDFNDNITGYLGYSTGSKPGGLKANDGNLGALMLAKVADLGPTGAQAYYQQFVGQPTVTPADLAGGLTLAQGNGVLDFEDEEAESLEIGTKMLLADGAATLNISVFMMDFDNLQTSSYDGTRFIIGNAASAEVQGLEVESDWQATDSLRLTGSVAFIDATYKDYAGAQCLVADSAGTFVNAGCTDGQENLAGRNLQRSPEFEFNLSADWETQFTANTLFTAGISFYHSDGYHTQEDEHPLGVQDSYQKWDLRLGLSNNDDTWALGLIGRNLSDELVIQHAYEIAGAYFNAVSQGRTVALEGTMRF